MTLAAGKPPEGTPPRHLCTTAIDHALPAAVVPTALMDGAHREADEADQIGRIRAGERTIDIYGFGDA